MRMKNEYAVLLGNLFAFLWSLIFSSLDIGIRVSGLHIHHFYIALILLIPMAIIHFIKYMQIGLRKVPIWLIYFGWGILFGLIISEIIFVVDYGFWGYPYLD